MKLEGLLVDLVPYGDAYKELEHAWHNSEAAFFWSMGGRWIVSQAQLERNRQWQAENRQNRIAFGVQTKDGTPIGYFGLHRVSWHNRMAALSAMIGDPDYWGGGYGTDALLLIADYAFDWLDFHKLWLMTMTYNARVLRQMEKVGFRQEARPREATAINREWIDAVIYGVLRDEWPGRAAMIEKLGLRAKS